MARKYVAADNKFRFIIRDSVNDFNDAVLSGIYNISPGTINGPYATNYGTLIMFGNSDLYTAVQLYFEENQSFSCRRYGGSTQYPWSSWSHYNAGS